MTPVAESSILTGFEALFVITQAQIKLKTPLDQYAEIEGSIRDVNRGRLTRQRAVWNDEA